MEKLFLATRNRHKSEKITQIFEPFSVKPLVHSADHIKLLSRYEEVGETFLEVAEDKALYISKIIPDILVVATDGGMEIPGLGASWNPIYTRRFINNLHATDFQRMDELLRRMEYVTDRSMRWNEAIAVAYSGKIVLSNLASGATGEMQREYDPTKYRRGIWLCSLWYFPNFGKNFFDLTPEESEYAEQSWQKLTQIIHENWHGKIESLLD